MNELAHLAFEVGRAVLVVAGIGYFVAHVLTCKHKK
jgi:hypothetical protein